MTDKEKLDKLVAEIERRKKMNILNENKYEEDIDLLSFIDSMLEECNITGIKSKHATGKLKECIDNVSEEGLEQARKQLQEELVSEDLEEAAKHYLYSNILYDDVYVGNPTDKDCIEMFKAGAKWQEKKDQSIIELAEDHAMLAGMEKMKEQMMKEAVDGTVFTQLEDGEIMVRSHYFKSEKFNYLDEVKLIIIKEE